MIDTTRPCCAGVSFFILFDKLFWHGSIGAKTLSTAAVRNILFGCMKLQLTSAKIINNLADSDCKYYYLKDSLPCKCVLNGAYKMGGPGSASIPNFAWVSWEAHYCTS